MTTQYRTLVDSDDDLTVYEDSAGDVEIDLREGVPPAADEDYEGNAVSSYARKPRIINRDRRPRESGRVDGEYVMQYNSKGESVLVPQLLTGDWHTAIKDVGNTKMFPPSEARALTAFHVPGNIVNFLFYQRAYVDPEPLVVSHHECQRKWDAALIGWAREVPVAKPGSGNTQLYGDVGVLPEEYEISPSVRDHEFRKNWMKTDCRGHWPESFWPTSIAYDFFFRINAFFIYLAAFWVFFGFLVTDHPQFQNRVQLTTDFLTDGVQPTPENGLTFHIGNLKYGWVIMFAFGAAAMLHAIYVSMVAIVGALCGLDYPNIKFLFGPIGRVFNRYIVENLMIGFDPSQFAVSMFCESVVFTLVGVYIGFNNMIEIMMLFGLFVLFFHGFTFTHAYNFSYWAYVIGYSAPTHVARIRGDPSSSSITMMPVFASAHDEPTWGDVQRRVSTHRRLAAYPNTTWRILTKVVSNLRQLIDFEPASSLSTRAKYRNATASSLGFNATPSVENSSNVRVGQEVNRKVATECTATDVMSMPELCKDFEKAINHGGHMMSGWFAFALLTMALFSYYFGALHSSDGAFNWAQHVSFWLMYSCLLYTVIANCVRWYDASHRARSWVPRVVESLTNVISLHHVIVPMFVVSIGFIIVVGEKVDVINAAAVA